LVPNVLHGSEADWYAKRYPDAQVLIPYAMIPSFRKKTRVSGSLEQDWPKDLEEEILCLPVRGVRIHECVFLHRPSKTLVTTDLVFNMQNQYSVFVKTFMKLNNIHQRFGPSRIFQYAVVRDPDRLASSLKIIGTWDFNRVIMSHGNIVEEQGRQKFMDSFLLYLT
jgi:hypothetical protein